MDGKFKEIRWVLIFILILNWLVAAAKIIVGWMFGIMSMVADGFHSFSDGTSNIVGLVGLSFASQPIDQDHPYGHKKIETFTALAIALLLLLVCYEIVRSTVDRLLHPRIPEANLLTFVVMGVTLAVNIWVVWYELKKGRELKSDILVSDSLHTRSDVFTSILVIISLFSIRLGAPIIDALASFVIVGIILYAIYEIVSHVFGVLVDRAVISHAQVEKIVLACPNVKMCHKVRSRGREDDVHVDLHISVDPNMSVGESHKLSHDLQEEIKAKVPGVTDVIIHIEPSRRKS
jgi:cation diffusion facilitator family transporter